MKNRKAYRRAKKRVETKLGFYIHLTAYIAVNILLVVINYNTYRGYWWFVWPLFGWGIGLIFHALAFFIFGGKSAIKEKMIEKEMKKNE